MEALLTDTEVRVLGALIEKEITTPEYYPLSLNSVVTACNQTSNRNPVVHFEESTVAGALDSLREKQLVHMVDRGARVLKYRHVLYEALELGRPAIALLCVLMLRGPQTVGELRTRSGRLYDFASLEETEVVLNSLMAGERPLAARLSRQTGQKEVRYAHLLCGEVRQADAEPAPEPEMREPSRLDRLEQELEELKRQFAEFRKQFE